MQVPMQYCSLQHRILLSSPDTSTTDNKSLHSSVDVCFSYFHVLAIVNSAAMNFGVHVYGVFIFSGHVPRRWIAGNSMVTHMVTLFLVFKGTSILFSIVVAVIFLSIM